ncbi:hypothetical protein BKA62DRAFT_679479, partial [Auriculariales sp. MPI-PUGE-AT-0066]
MAPRKPKASAPGPDTAPQPVTDTHRRSTRAIGGSRNAVQATVPSLPTAKGQPSTRGILPARARGTSRSSGRGHARGGGGGSSRQRQASPPSSITSRSDVDSNFQPELGDLEAQEEEFNAA